MKIRKLIVLCATMAMGVTLAANSQQVVVQPSQGGGQGGFTVRPFEARVLKGQPYSAETSNESIQTLSDGNRIVHKTTGRVYRDVEGRVRREDDRPSGDPAVSISDPVANMSWTLNAATKTAVEMSNAGFFVNETLNGLVERFNFIQPTAQKPAIVGQPTGAVGRGGAGGGVAAGGGARGGRGAGTGAGAGTGDPTAARMVGSTDPQSVGRAGGGGRGGRSQQNVDIETLPNKSIENLLCTGVRRTTTIAKDAVGNEQPIKIVSEEWTSIDLQVLVLTDLNDPRSGHVTYKLTNVRRADPDLTLFKVPSDYTITHSGGGRGRGGN